jgi:hypothetical protein
LASSISSGSSPNVQAVYAGRGASTGTTAASVDARSGVVCAAVARPTTPRGWHARLTGCRAGDASGRLRRQAQRRERLERRARLRAERRLELGEPARFAELAAVLVDDAHCSSPGAAAAARA